MPEETFYVEGIQIAKRGIAMDIQKFLPELAETKFVETFKAEPKPVAAAPAPAPLQQLQNRSKPAEAKTATEAKTAESAKPQKLQKPQKLLTSNYNFSLNQIS